MSVPELATLREASALLKLSERKVWQMGRDGEIGVVRFGRAVRYLIRAFLVRLEGK